MLLITFEIEWKTFPLRNATRVQVLLFKYERDAVGLVTDEAAEEEVRSLHISLPILCDLLNLAFGPHLKDYLISTPCAELEFLRNNYPKSRHVWSISNVVGEIAFAAHSDPSIAVVNKCLWNLLSCLSPKNKFAFFRSANP